MPGRPGTLSRSDRKRREILDTARGLFLKEGFAGAGMETLAREAGVSTATLYAHFPSKSEMFRTVVEEAVAELARRVRDTTTQQGDPHSRLCGFAYAYAEFYADPLSRSVFRMVTAERRRFGGVADYFQDRAHSELGGAAIEILGDLAAAAGHARARHIGLRPGRRRRRHAAPPAQDDLRRRGRHVPGPLRNLRMPA
jgi:AcrR family transcriptional regulator